MRVVSWIEIEWLFITTLHWTVTNWSSLEAFLQSVRWFKVRADLNTLNHLEVIWSTEPIWNICIIQYFWSVINLNKRHSNETLFGGVVIQISAHGDRRRVRYQLSHATSLNFYLILTLLCSFVTVTLIMYSVFYFQVVMLLALGMIGN
jgi:hypothetical protein